MFGTKGLAEFSKPNLARFRFVPVSTVAPTGPVTAPPDEIIESPAFDTLNAELVEFARCIAEKRPYPVAIDQVLHGMSVFDAVVRSGKSGQDRESGLRKPHGKTDHHGRLRLAHVLPAQHLCPTQEDIPGVTQQYVDAVKAGAAIAHIHGRRTLEESIQADGKMVSKIHHADWKKLHDSIMSKVDPIMQYGVASARIEEKIELMKLGPDMMAVAFNAHDEYFQPVPTLPPKRMMAIHPVEELIAYAKAAEEHKVKLECECFQTGAFWHLEFVRKAGYLKKQTYVTLFIGWPGGTWMPPTERALQFFVDNLPPDVHLERQRDEPGEAMVDPGARGRARRPRPCRLRGQPVHRAGRVRQEQRRAGRPHGRHRAAARPRGGDARRSAENPGLAAVAIAVDGKAHARPIQS